MRGLNAEDGAGWRAWARRVPGARALYRRWSSGDLVALERSMAAGSALAPMQPWTTTAEDRYPELFDRLAGELAAKADARVLSFGCAGGEEVRALRRRMPAATIVGVDVNPRALSRARRKDRHHRSCYLIGDRPPPGAPFDAILALAVFRHGTLERQRLTSCADLLPFAQAAATFAALDAALRPGGLLAFGNAHFRLADLPGGEHYALVATFDEELARSQPLFGPDDRLIDGASAAGGLFRKRG